MLLRGFLGSLSLFNFVPDKPDVVGGIAGLTVYSSNKDDPYVTLPDDSDNDSEKGDDLIKPNDNLVLVGHVVGDQATLEVYGM